MPPIHPNGNVIRHQRIVSGDPSRSRATWWSRATTRSACRTRRSWDSRRRWRCPTRVAPASSCSSRPSGCTRTGTRSPRASDWPDDAVRLTLGGVGGAFGAREDISLQVHTCLLALRTGRPVRMAYSREESFLGHVHRHPATHLDASPRDGRWAHRSDRGAVRARRWRVRVDVVGGADQRDHPHAGPVQVRRTRRSTGTPCAPTTCRAARCVASAWCRRASPTRARWTSWPLRAVLDPVEIRLRNAMETGDRLITGQVIENVAPVARCIRETAALPLPDEPVGGHDGDPMRLPGGAGLTADRRHIRRGIGWGVVDQEPDVLRGLRRLLDGSLPAGRRRGLAEVRDQRGRAGLRDAGRPDRPLGAGRRRRRARADRHHDRIGRARRRHRGRRG